MVDLPSSITSPIITHTHYAGGWGRWEYALFVLRSHPTYNLLEQNKLSFLGWFSKFSVQLLPVSLGSAVASAKSHLKLLEILRKRGKSHS